MTERSDKAVARRGRAFARFARPIGPGRRSGQILVMALLAVSLMVGLIFFVYNTGDYVNRRLTMQNVADAVVISGANWTARSMNVIAMNNCAQSRMLALVPVFDALPLATEMALDEITAWEGGVAGQLARGLPYTKDDYLRVGMENLQQRMAGEREALEGLNEVFNVSLDMRTVTYWQIPDESSPRPHGSLWRTAKALEEFSFMTWQSSAYLAQANAVRFGQANGADVAILLPLTPMVPARVGEYMDFQPVLVGEARVYGTVGTMRPTGGLGGGIPDFAYPHRLGPWATLYRWRRWLIEYLPGVPGPAPTPPPDPGPRPVVRTRGRTGTSAPGGNRTASAPGHQRDGPDLAGSIADILALWEGDVPMLVCSGRGRGVGSGLTSPTRIVMGWYTYGPYEWARNTAVTGARDQFSLSLYPSYINTLSNAKLTYMFAAPEELKTIYYPEWVHTNSYPSAKAMAEGGQLEEITETLYYRVEVRSSIPPTSANYLTEGTFVGNIDAPRAVWMNGWRDADTWEYYEKVGDYVWRDRFEYETTYFPAIGIVNTVVSDGEDSTEAEIEYRPVYVDVYYIWGGIDIGEAVDVRNPFNWEEGEQLPRPLLFDPGPNGELDYMSGYEDGKAVGYGFLGVAGKKVRAEVWSSRFVDISPVDGIVTVAHAKLFNNRSWGLWTQDWQVQLSPISKWEEWLWELEKAWAELDLVGDLVDPGEFEKIDQYLRNIDEDMILRFFRH